MGPKPADHIEGGGSYSGLGDGDGFFEQDVVADAGGHVGQRQPEQLGVPAGRVAFAGRDGRHGVLHAAHHLHQVAVAQLGDFVCYDVQRWGGKRVEWVKARSIKWKTK